MFFAVFLAAALCVPPAGDAAFRYDARAPLHVRFDAVKTRGATAERDLHFVAGGRSVGATLVRPRTPSGPLRGAAILWVHWLGDPATTNRTEFLGDARALGARGATSLLVDAMWAQPHWFGTVRSTATDACDVPRQVVALRRALDVLVAQGIDAERIAYVGHDFGAMYGTLLLAIDRRPSRAVLMTPTLSFWEWFLLGKSPSDYGAYVATMSRYDLPAWLARTHARSILLQFAKNDEYVSGSSAAVIANAVPAKNRTATTYDADHALKTPRASADRRAWLESGLSHFRGTKQGT